MLENNQVNVLKKKKKLGGEIGGHPSKVDLQPYQSLV